MHFLCTVTYITAISLLVTLSNLSHSLTHSLLFKMCKQLLGACDLQSLNIQYLYLVERRFFKNQIHVYYKTPFYTLTISFVYDVHLITNILITVISNIASSCQYYENSLIVRKRRLKKYYQKYWNQVQVQYLNNLFFSMHASFLWFVVFITFYDY